MINIALANHSIRGTFDLRSLQLFFSIKLDSIYIGMSRGPEFRSNEISFLPRYRVKVEKVDKVSYFGEVSNGISSKA